MVKARRPARFAALAMIASLSACSHDQREEPASEQTAAAEDAADQCGAVAMQSYVGKPVSALPPAQENWRVTCTQCPVTMDYREDRLNVFFDQDTQIIEEIRCG